MLLYLWTLIVLSLSQTEMKLTSLALAPNTVIIHVMSLRIGEPVSRSGVYALPLVSLAGRVYMYSCICQVWRVAACKRFGSPACTGQDRGVVTAPSCGKKRDSRRKGKKSWPLKYRVVFVRAGVHKMCRF